MTKRPEIEQRSLGRSALQVPRVALGCGNFGGVGSAPAFFGQGLDERQAAAVMDAAWELGIEHFDTADAYGGGRSETMIGDWIRARGKRPLITTKTYNPMAEGADRGLARARVVRQLDASLGRLGVDHVDLYLAHEYDPEVPLEEMASTFEALVAAGKVRAWGVSNFDAGELRRAAAAGPLACVQNSHSLLDRADEGAVLPACAELGIGYAAFGPLAGGWLTGKYRRGEPFPPGSRMTQRPEPYEAFLDDEVYDRLDRLAGLAARRGGSPAGVALGWLLADERVTQVVVGPGSPQHLEPVTEALAHPLAGAELAELERVFA